MEKTVGGSTPGIGADREQRRVLVVATEELSGDELADLLSGRGTEAEGEIRVLAPAVTDSQLRHAFGDVDDAIEDAQERLERSLAHVRDRGIAVSGRVGDSDPVIAIEDQLAEFAADEIVIVTRPESEAAWLEGDLFERARRKFEPPITHVTVEHRHGGSEIVDIEREGAGVEPEAEARRSGYSRNIPSLSWRDLAGILVALFGSIILVILAADCKDASDPGCVVRYIAAGAMALVNIAHVVGLLLFESVGYRGLWERSFARLSLIGTPTAIVVSLLAH
jgi:hypothetical protein